MWVQQGRTSLGPIALIVLAPYFLIVAMLYCTVYLIVWSFRITVYIYKGVWELCLNFYQSRSSV